MENELVVLAEVKYPVSLDEIKAFKAKWAKVPTLQADVGIKDKQFLEVKMAHLESVRFRTAIERKRKELKEPALLYGKQVDSIAKEYTALLEGTELALFSERSKVERYEQEQEQLRIDAEMARIKIRDEKVYALHLTLNGAIGKCSTDLQKIYEGIAIPDEAVYQERTDEAIEIYKSILVKLEGMIEQAEKAEQADKINAEAEARRKAEDAQRQAALKKEREDFEREKAAFAREVNAKAEREALEKAEQEAEEYAKQQAEELEKAEQEAEEQKNETLIAIRNVIKQWQGEGDVAEGILQAILDGTIPNVKWNNQ